LLLILAGRFHPKEELIPFEVLGGLSASTRKGLIQYVGIGYSVHEHQSPVRKSPAAGAADLKRKQVDGAADDSVVVGFNNPIPVQVAEPKQPSVLDRSSDQFIELRIGCWHAKDPSDHFACLVPGVASGFTHIDSYAISLFALFGA
jgi:hypothetical protein